MRPNPSPTATSPATAAALRFPRVISTTRTADLSEQDRDELWSLFVLTARTTREVFDQRLSAMDELWRLHIAGELMGFGGVSTLHVEVGGRRCCVLFTGRVYLRPEARGGNVIQRVGAGYFLRERLRHPLMPIYWMFSAATYKSYLLLARNFGQYWPRPGAELPAHERAIVAAVFAAQNNRDFDANAGIVREPHVSWSDAAVPDDAALQADPDLAFYATRNPGHGGGDVLVCLAPLTVRNWVSIATRAMARGFRGG